MKWVLKIFLLTYLLTFSMSASAYAQGGDRPSPSPVILTAEQGEYPLGLPLEYLTDPNGQLTIDDITSPGIGR